VGSAGMILAGDVGGTKTDLTLMTVEGNRLVTRAQASFSSPNYPSLEAILREFLQQHRPESVLYACFGVPGPVVQGSCVTTNLGWVVELRKVQQALNSERVALLNDLEAMGYGVADLIPDQLLVLNAGWPWPEANAAIIAAGTGLGEAILFWDGRQHRPVASEGGHTDFAPRTPLEMDFLRYALARLGHVSYDHVVSGPGLHLIYCFLRDTGKAEEPAWLAEKLGRGDPSAAITEVALAGQVELCVQALDMFVSFYGAEAGNLALKTLARAGIYLGGGIAPKILTKLQDGTFMRAFTAKGRMSALVSEIPVRVILEPKTALHGTARYAAQQAGCLS